MINYLFGRLFDQFWDENALQWNLQRQRQSEEAVVLFLERQGLDLPDADITIRQDAPTWLRSMVLAIAYDVDIKPSTLRTLLCAQLMETPDPGNWSEFPNINGEVSDLIERAPWFFVYDLMETIYARLRQGYGHDPSKAAAFAEKLNRVFRKKGVGWQLVDGLIQVRGPEVFEHALATAVELAAATSREVARRELHEALRDLSRRPEPELTGAIQHAMAALECVARDITNQPNLTLGDWLKRNPQVFPAPLGAAVEKLWGYASEYGRHVREGRPPNFEEAEMVVGIAGSLTVFLLRKR
jgi:hypothetical protein